MSEWVSAHIARFNTVESHEIYMHVCIRWTRSRKKNSATARLNIDGKSTLTGRNVYKSTAQSTTHTIARRRSTQKRYDENRKNYYSRSSVVVVCFVVVFSCKLNSKRATSIFILYFIHFSQQKLVDAQQFNLEKKTPNPKKVFIWLLYLEAFV